MRWIRSTLAIALFAVLVLPGSGGVARATTSTPEVAIDWREGLDYLNCILSIVAATNGPGMGAALTSCSKAIMDHWDD